MKVCLVSSFPPNRARLSEYCLSLVPELANQKVVERIYVLADKAHMAKDREVIDEKCEIRRVWRIDDPLSILSIPLTILRIKPDLVHINMHFMSFGRKRLANFGGFLLVPILRLLGFKVLVTIHNLAGRVNLAAVGVRTSVGNRLGMAVATRLLMTAGSVCVTVRSYAEYLGARYPEVSVRYVSHGFWTANHLASDPPQKTILMFGHMSPHKGLSVLLEAFSKTVQQFNGVKLVVAGSAHPNFPDFLGQFPKEMEGVEFKGYVPETELGSVFGGAYLVVLPYTAATGTSGVFHLACSFGKPVIASNLQEIREMVEEGASAILVPPRDSDALSTAIVRLLKDEALAARMSEANLAFARARSFSHVAKEYEKEYLNLLHDGRS